jgi:tetratricopeptide (TPR) repeat protein
MPAWLGVAAPALLAVVAIVPIVTTTAAVLAFDRARDQADRGSLVAAIEALDQAVRLDPTFPLYLRERGIMQLRAGRTAPASMDAVAATRLNPLDDSAYRALAIVSLEDGRTDHALRAARVAAELRGASAANQTVLALVAGAADESVERDEALARLLALAPWSAADESWQATYPGVEPSLSLQAAAALAIERPLADTVDQRWTRALAGAPGVTQVAGYTAAQEAFAHLVACRPTEALRVIDGAAATERSDSNYAFARAIVSQLSGAPPELARPPADPLAGPVLGDPVGDQARYARRSPRPWDGIELPSNNGGRLAWLRDPERALTVTRGSPCP